MPSRPGAVRAHPTVARSHPVAARAHPVVARAQPATRDLILDAAERRFAERGFAGVSMRELAAEAGLRNQASLYNHFRNKRALYEAVLARGVDPIVAVIAASGNVPRAAHGGAARVGSTAGGGNAPAAGNPGAFVDLLLDYLVEHPHLPRLIQRAALDDSRYLRSALTRLLRPLYAQGIRVLAAAEGPWQEAELPHLAAGLYQLIFGYFASAKLLETVVDGDPLSPAAIARQRRFVKAAVAQLLGAAPLARGVRASDRLGGSEQPPARERPHKRRPHR
jgi:TetR/AcrR family transcriptional regulator